MGIMILMVWGWLLWAALLWEGWARITYNSSLLESMRQVCQSAAVWKLNLCNLTCATCVDTNPNLCASCDANYVYDSTSGCSTSTSFNTFAYGSLLSTPIFYSSDIASFSMSMTGTPLSFDNVVEICQEESYSFQMLGLFSSTDEIMVETVYSETMQEFTLKFNLLLLVNESKLTVTFNSDQGVSKKVTNYYIADATATYAESTSVTTSSYLSIPSLSADTASSFIQVVTVTQAVYTSEISFSFSCVSPNAKGSQGHWAISDVVILATQCNTCVTNAVSAIIQSVGYITLYVLAVTATFLGLLFCFMRIISWQKERSLMASKNIGKDYLPVKPIDRIVNSIEHRKKEEPIDRTFLGKSKKDIQKSQ